MNYIWPMALTLGFSVIFCQTLSADDLDESPIAFEVGYRHDSLRITSKNQKRHADMTEKQQWKNIESYGFGISGATYTEYNVFLKGKLDYAQVYHVDFRLDTPLFNPLERYHKSHNGGGNTYAASIAVGFPIWFNCSLDWLHFIPMIGFDYDRLKLRSSERILTPGACGDSSGSHNKNHHRHTTHRHPCFQKARIHNRAIFESPWVGIDFVASCCRWKFFGGYQYNFGRLHSRCEYTVKKNFSYALQDRSWGHANAANLGVGYQFTTEWETAFNLRYKDWRSHEGKHKSTLKAPNASNHSHAKIKKLNWELWELFLYLILRY